jgi:hypothetical protein
MRTSKLWQKPRRNDRTPLHSLLKTGVHRSSCWNKFFPFREAGEFYAPNAVLNIVLLLPSLPGNYNGLKEIRGWLETL